MNNILTGGERSGQLLLSPELTLSSITTPKFKAVVDESENVKHKIIIDSVDVDGIKQTVIEFDNQGDTLQLSGSIELKNLRGIRLELQLVEVLSSDSQSYIESPVYSTLGLHINYDSQYMLLNMPVQYRFKDHYKYAFVLFSYFRNTTRITISLATFVTQDMIPTPSVLKHFNDNTTYYSRKIFERLDQTTLMTMLSQYTFLGFPLIMVAQPKPLGIVANMLVFRVNMQNIFSYVINEVDDQPAKLRWEAYLKQRGIDYEHIEEDIIPVPSEGVFAEPVLSRSKAAEKADITRYWNWQDSPIPLKASDILDISLASRATQSDMGPGQLGQSSINVVAPPNAPDPTGTASLIAGLTASNIFRDMSGVAATTAMGTTGINRTAEGASNAGAQAGANMQTAAQSAIAAAEIARDIIGTIYGMPPAGSKTSVTEQGAKINHGRDMDARGITSATNDGSSSAAINQPESSGGRGTGSGNQGMSGGSGTNLNTSSYEAAAHNNAVWGNTGRSTGSIINASAPTTTTTGTPSSDTQSDESTMSEVNDRYSALQNTFASLQTAYEHWNNIDGHDGYNQFMQHYAQWNVQVDQWQNNLPPTGIDAHIIQEVNRMREEVDAWYSNFPNDLVLMNDTRGMRRAGGRPDRRFYAPNSTMNILRRLGEDFATQSASDPGSPPYEYQNIFVTDLSYEHGGRMPPHAEHRTGHDADIWNPRLDQRRDDFDRARTQQVIESLLRLNVHRVIYTDHQAVDAANAAVPDNSVAVAGAEHEDHIHFDVRP